MGQSGRRRGRSFLDLEHAANLADLAHLLGAERQEHGPPVGQQLDDPQRRQFDERLAYRRGAHLEEFGKA